MQLKFNSVSFCQNGDTLLGPIDFETKIRGVTNVLGYNGAGKSLFLEMCHAMINPTLGCVHWNGNLAEDTKYSRGFIFQHRVTLYRSVKKNIALPMQTAGWNNKLIEDRLEELLNMAGLQSKSEEPASTLSGGEVQRMALVRALATYPKMVIMDEPTSSLDPSATTEFEKLISQNANSGIKFLWATHNITQAKRFADDIIFIADGKVSEISEAKKFFNNPSSTKANNYIKGL
jgi:tungstate transport system ATP-binding protein